MDLISIAVALVFFAAAYLLVDLLEWALVRDERL